MRLLIKWICYPFLKAIWWTKWKNKKVLKQFKGKPVILAFNHHSGWDGPIAFLDIHRHLHFWVKEEFFQTPGWRRFWRMMGGIPVKPGAELSLIRNTQEVFKQNRALVVMPEGHRTFNANEKLEVRNGTAMVALRSQVPIVPIMMNRRIKPFRLTTFKVGDPIDTTQFLVDGRPTKEGMLALSAALQEQMHAMLVGYEKPEKLPAWKTAPSIIARGIVIRDEQLLAIERCKNGEHYYVFPGGHAEPGEEIQETCRREVLEETGVSVRPFRDLYKFWFHDHGGRGDGYQTFYVCEYENGEPHETDAEEYTQPNRICGTYHPTWVAMADLPNLDVRPAVLKNQLIKDYQKKGARLSFPLRLLPGNAKPPKKCKKIIDKR